METRRRHASTWRLQKAGKCVAGNNNTPNLLFLPFAQTSVIMAGVTQRVRNVRIQLLLKGCANRPFYHLVAARLRRRPRDTDTIEQIGSFDPMPNERNEKLVAINFDRLNYWFGQGAKTSPGAGMLLGLAGYTSVHPKVYMKAWRNRRAALAEEQAGKEAAEAKDEAAKAES